MKTEEYKSIEDLLDRFFEGQTSNEEEQVLYEFFARPDIPAHLERYREVFGYFESGIALDFSETPELRLPVKESSDKRKNGMGDRSLRGSFSFIVFGEYGLYESKCFF